MKADDAIVLVGGVRFYPLVLLSLFQLVKSPKVVPAPMIADDTLDLKDATRHKEYARHDRQRLSEEINRGEADRRHGADDAGSNEGKGRSFVHEAATIFMIQPA